MEERVPPAVLARLQPSERHKVGLHGSCRVPRWARQCTQIAAGCSTTVSGLSFIENNKREVSLEFGITALCHMTLEVAKLWHGTSPWSERQLFLSVQRVLL